MTPKAQAKIDEFIKQGNVLKVIYLDNIQKEHPLNCYYFKKHYKIKMQQLNINIDKKNKKEKELTNV